MELQADFATAGPSVVLVVEDEILVRTVVAEYLQDEGFRVIAARNADEAVKALHAFHVDVVFADIVLLGASGIELARWIRQYKPTVKIVLTSGTPELSDAVEFGPVIAKPYLYSEVSARLWRELHDAGGAAGRRCSAI